MDIETFHVDVTKIVVKPGEVLVVKTHEPVTTEIAARIRDAFERAFEASGTPVKRGSVLVLCPGLEISVVQADLAHGLPSAPETERP